MIHLNYCTLKIKKEHCNNYKIELISYKQNNVLYYTRTIKNPIMPQILLKLMVFALEAFEMSCNKYSSNTITYKTNHLILIELDIEIHKIQLPFVQ